MGFALVVDASYLYRDWRPACDAGDKPRAVDPQGLVLAKSTSR